MVILRSVLEVDFTKYFTCVAENPGQPEQDSREWTEFSSILELEPYMLKAHLRKKLYMGIKPVAKKWQL